MARLSGAGVHYEKVDARNGKMLHYPKELVGGSPFVYTGEDVTGIPGSCVRCLGCGEVDATVLGSVSGLNPFARFDAIKHDPKCPYREFDAFTGRPR